MNYSKSYFSAALERKCVQPLVAEAKNSKLAFKEVLRRARERLQGLTNQRVPVEVVLELLAVAVQVL